MTKCQKIDSCSEVVNLETRARICETDCEACSRNKKTPTEWKAEEVVEMVSKLEKAKGKL